MMDTTQLQREEDSPLVFLTGATGHIGFRVLAQLLAAKYRVRVASRSLASAQRLATLPSIVPHKSLLSFVEITDFLSPAAFSTALQDVTYIIHVASPLPDLANQSFDLDADYLDPASLGTLNVLRAAVALGPDSRLKRVVVTSSVGVLDKAKSNNPSGHQIGPDDLAAIPPRDIMASNVGAAYVGSKILALRAAEEFMATNDPKPEFELVHILPAYVQGRNEAARSLQELAGKTSNGNIVRFVLGQDSTKEGQAWGDPADFVHVDDVAQAHVAALTKGRHGDRFIVANNSASGSYEAILPIVRDLFPREVETSLLPLKGKVLPRSVLVEVEGKAGQFVGGYDARLSEEVLGIEVKGLREMVKSLVGQVVEFVQNGEKLD